MPEVRLFKTVTDKVRQVDNFGRYTAAAGHALYTARNYPEEYWNRTAFVAEPTGHIVGTFVITREGTQFQIDAIPSISSPATTSGPRPSWLR